MLDSFFLGVSPWPAAAMERNPDWIRRTSQRIIQGLRLESSTVGHARRRTAADLVRYSQI